MNGECLEESLDNQMPTSEGLVGNESVTVLRDIACSGVIVKKNLEKQEQLTDNIGYLMTVARTLLKTPFACVEVSTSYFSGTVETLCLKNPLYELMTGNIPEAKAPDDPVETCCVKQFLGHSLE